MGKCPPPDRGAGLFEVMYFSEGFFHRGIIGNGMRIFGGKATVILSAAAPTSEDGRLLRVLVSI